MCGRCEDSKEITSKNFDGSIRGAFVILVLFSVTLSALGISCYALFTVQSLFHDVDSLKLVLRRSRLELAKQHAYEVKNEENLAVGPIYEPLDVNANTHKFQRLKRNADLELKNEELSENGFQDVTTEPEFTSIENKPQSPLKVKQELFSSKNIIPSINNENIIAEAHTENPDFPRDSESGETKNTVKNFFQTAETTTSSTENIELFQNVHGNSSETTNPLKKDVEIVDTRRKNVTLKKYNSEISPVIEGMEFQADHHIKKKAADYDDDVESFTPEYRVTHSVHRHRPRGRNGNQLEIIDEFSPQAGRLKSLIAVHLDGDTSQYMLGVHTNYKGNGHLRHAQKTFVDWKISDWVETISATHSFHLKNGVLTVKDSGLYFIYAQIYYLDEHDSNGYLILRNSEKILHCKVTAPSSERQLKGNTCYTGAVVFLESNDRISIDDISDGRYTLFVPGYSFFGMIKLGDVKGK